MTWSTTRKSLDITDKRAHIPTWARASGRAPTGTSIDFSPLELFGAAARCNFLHAINPTVATPQSNAMAALIEMFVNDPGSDFAILASADDIKDFAKSYFSGTVAQGLAYLAMIREGYSWSDHFEALGGGNPAVTRKPDFVFGGHGAGVALMESKGSRSQSLTTFDTTVADGYDHQVDPHLGHPIGGIVATHGYCVGAHLKSTTKAELRVHFTDAASSGPQGGSDDSSALAQIQHGNYATAMSLVHSPTLGRRIRRRERIDEEIPFLEFSLYGRSWLTTWSEEVRVVPEFESRFRGPGLTLPDLERPRPRPSMLRFAIEARTAQTVLRTYLRGEPPGSAPPFERVDLIDDVRRDAGSLATFPDGLAVLGRDADLGQLRRVAWRPDEGEID